MFNTVTDPFAARGDLSLFTTMVPREGESGPPPKLTFLEHFLGKIKILEFGDGNMFG